MFTSRSLVVEIRRAFVERFAALELGASDCYDNFAPMLDFAML